ncbi:astacin-like [Oratosquilla oratoria]|uniref:astacin-like n=1 Tax=Oratosquilla oratoria TaxID=337810 RepID=UPI003F775DBB
MAARSLVFLLGVCLGLALAHRLPRPQPKGNPDRYLYNEGLFEGDILGPKPEGRSAVLGDSYRWPGGVIPYVIDSSLSGYEYIILDGMTEIEHKTCIRFKSRTNEADYINIASFSGCWSMVGRQGGMQYVSLDMYGCLWRGLVEHELMHAIGFWHEHNRPDRDDYVTILWENVQQGLEYAFEKRVDGVNSIYVGEGYQYQSIMHYEFTAFALSQDLYTMQPLQSVSVDPVWTRELIQTDVNQINGLYGCYKDRNVTELH